MRRIAIYIILLFSFTSLQASEVSEDSLAVAGMDSMVISNSISPSDTIVQKKPKRNFFQKVGDFAVKAIKAFDEFDSTYIEKQHYDWTVTLISTNTYDKYILKDVEGQKITFAPEMAWHAGPYGGWSWAYYGFTFDINHFFRGSSKSTRQQYDFSIYSNMFVADIWWMTSGNDFGIKRFDYLIDSDADAAEMADFFANSINFSTRGFNLYYVLNHKKFSYNSIYTQSTQQRKSAGSVILGLGYSRHSLSIDKKAIYDHYGGVLEMEDIELILDIIMFNKMKFADLSLSAGYAYNWVFAKNWVFNASVSAALAYNQPKTYNSPSKHLLHFHDFSLKHFNVHETGRFGIIWNNGRWYAGANALLRFYNFGRTDEYSYGVKHNMNSYNVLVGYNFGKYKK